MTGNAPKPPSAAEFTRCYLSPLRQTFKQSNAVPVRLARAGDAIFWAAWVGWARVHHDQAEYCSRSLFLKRQGLNAWRRGRC